MSESDFHDWVSVWGEMQCSKCGKTSAEADDFCYAPPAPEETVKPKGGE